MKCPRLMYSLTNAAFMVWLSAIALLIATEKANANISNEFCDAAAVANCPAAGNNCGGPPCTTAGIITGSCNSFSWFSCKNKQLLCSNSFGCCCNFILC